MNSQLKILKLFLNIIKPNIKVSKAYLLLKFFAENFFVDDDKQLLLILKLTGQIAFVTFIKDFIIFKKILRKFLRQ